MGHVSLKILILFLLEYWVQSAVRLVSVLLVVYIKDIQSLIDSDTVPTGILGRIVSCVILVVVRLVVVLLILYRHKRYYGKLCHFGSCTVSWCSIDSHIKDVHVDQVSLIESDTVPTGILGIMMCHFVNS